MVRVADGAADHVSYLPTRPLTPHTAEGALEAGVDVLRSSLEAHLDQHPETLLQLTGGLDSRILLAAVPVSRRRGLRVMTLDVPGSQDAAIAGQLACRFGMDHEVISFAGLEQLGPDQAWELCTEAARRVECSADPLAAAAVRWAESGLMQGPRLAGLGGEVARGFYYVGSTRPQPITRRRCEQLARWRLMPNGSVPVAHLDGDFARHALATVIDDVFTFTTAAAEAWWPATDEFYLGQRMYRWAGALASSTAYDRPVTNPMLERRFLDIARSLPPHEKKNMKYLSRLVRELDGDLAAVPLDGRPAPASFAEPGLRTIAASGLGTGRKVWGKVQQRLHGERRPPVGGAVLASRCLEHLRGAPEVLTRIGALGVMDERYLDAVAAGSAEADPATTSLMVVLAVATESWSDGTVS